MDGLEAQTYPENLRSLGDVNMPSLLDQKAVKYDLATDKFVLGDVGIPEVANDGKRYVRVFNNWEEEKNELIEMNDVAISGEAPNDFLKYNGSSWINDPSLAVEQTTQNNRLDGIDTEQTTQNNRLDALEAQTYPESLANLTDVQINSPLQDAQVLVNIGGVWGNYTIDISQQPPIVDLDNRVDVLEAQIYPESLWNLVDVNFDLPNDDQKYV